MAGLMGIFTKLVGSKAQLKADASAAGGGAAGLLATSYVLPMTDGLPLVGAAPRWARQAVLGVVAGRVARLAPLPVVDRDAFACGVVGAVSGHAIASFIGSMLGQSVSAGLAEVLPETYPLSGPFDAPQIGPLDDTVQMPSASELAEVLPEEQFAAIGGLNAQPIDADSMAGFIGGVH